MLSKAKSVLHHLGPLYYREVQRIIDPSTAHARFLYHHGLNLLLLLNFLRCLVVLGSLLLGDDRWFAYDAPSDIRRHMMQYDPFLVLCISSLFLFLAIHNTIYYFAGHHFIWQLIAELVVGNCVDFVHSNQTAIAAIRQKTCTFNVVNWWYATKQCLALLRGGDRLAGQPIHFHQRLLYFSMSSKRTRVRTCAAIFALEVALSAMLSIVLLGALVGLLTYGHFIFHLDIVLIHKVTSLLEQTYCFYMAWIGFKLGCFALYTHLIPLFAITSTYQELDQTVVTVHCDHWWSVPYKLWRYRREHARLTGYILATDDRFWSAGLVNFYLHNIPINVYIVSYLTYRHAEDLVRAFLLYVLAIQLFAIIMSMLPAAKSSARLHASRHYMCTLQGKLKTRHLWLKLKYIAFSEQVTTDRQIGYHVGPFMAISKRSIFELFYIYVGFYLYTIRLVRNQ